MQIGEKIKQCRDKQGMTQQEVAEKSGYSRNSIINWEKGIRIPDANVVKTLAQILGTSAAYLMDETDDPEFTRSPKDIDTRWIKIPLVDHTKICTALKDGKMNIASAETAEYMVLPADMLGPIGERKPFAVKVEGNSMEDAGIFQGSEAAVNPEMEVSDGDAALVCFGSKNECAIKWVYFHSDGGVELRSSNPKYPPRFYSRQELEDGWCRIIGKVVRTLQAPGKGI